MRKIVLGAILFLFLIGVFLVFNKDLLSLANPVGVLEEGDEEILNNSLSEEESDSESEEDNSD